MVLNLALGTAVYTNTVTAHCVAEAITLRPMLTAMEECVWLDSRNIAMFLMTSNKLNLVNIRMYTHTYSYL